MMVLLVFALTACFLIVAVHRRSKSFENAAKWCGLAGSEFKVDALLSNIIVSMLTTLFGPNLVELPFT